jgi:hypothetical protein
MTGEIGKTLAATALECIDAAFADRAPPAAMTDSKQLSDLEYEEVMSFAGLPWRDVTFAQIAANPDAVFWFAPEAFCYYLPGFLAAGLKENRWDTNAYDSLIGMLDRSAEPDYWDDFFRPRWTLLSAAQVEAVAAWVEWLKVVQSQAYFGNTFERVLDTLKLLKERRPSG